MATVQECEAAFGRLADRLAAADPAARKKAAFDRTLSCTLPDLSTSFGARLHDGQLSDVRQIDHATAAQAKVRMTLSSDDLIELVDGRLNVASAWTSGRAKVEASVMDLLKLRTIF